MRAVVVERFAWPEGYWSLKRSRPRAGAGRALVRVMAAGTNPVDAKLRQFGGGRRVTAPVILGYDVSGVVEAVGPGVTKFEPGDEVYYMLEVYGKRPGGYAEYNVVPETIVVRKPPSLSHEEAAAVPLACGTAWEGIVRRLKVQPGETVLIHGGAGGVGSFAVQLAKACGARVIASAGTSNQETLKRLGVDVAVDYTREDPIEVAREATGGDGVDAVFDAVGGGPDLSEHPRDKAIRPHGDGARPVRAAGAPCPQKPHALRHPHHARRDSPRSDDPSHRAWKTSPARR